MKACFQKLAAAAATDVGKVRAQNEDAHLVDIEHGLFIVSDGMGGMQAGEVASKVVVEVLPRMIEQRLAGLEKTGGQSLRKMLSEAIVELSGQLCCASATQPGLKGMGATLVLVLIRGRCACVAHMGDSRVYLFRNGKLTQLTEDHSLVALLLRRGDITPRQAKTHPARSQISRYVGMEGELGPDVSALMLKVGDRLLLCSDGLTGMVADNSIRTILKTKRDPKTACESLIEAANAAGGHDNITAVVLNCE